MRVHSIDLLKVIFTYLVVFGHMDIYYPGAAVAVDFFFVFTGFFLAKKFYSRTFGKAEDGYNQFKYISDRVKTLYPQYVFSLLVLFCYVLGKDVVRIVTGSPLAGSLGDLVARCYELVPDMLMIQDIGFLAGGLNAAAWYVSVMIIGGYFIYACMCRDEKLCTEIVFPALFILMETFIKDGREPFGVIGPLYMAMYRGVVAMLLGVIIYKFSMGSWYKKFCENRFIFNGVGICSVAALFFCERYGNIHIVMFAFMVLYLYNPSALPNRFIKGKIFNRMGDWAYAVYLNHSVVIMVLEDAFGAMGAVMPREQFAWIAAAAAGVYSVITVILLDKIKAALKKKNIL